MMDSKQLFVKTIRFMLMNESSAETKSFYKEFGISRNDMMLWSTEKTLPQPVLFNMMMLHIGELYYW